MVANFSIVERECDFTGVEGTGAIFQHGRPPRIYIRVRRRATQSSLPGGLLEGRPAKGIGSNGRMQVKWIRFWVLAPVGVDDRLAAVAQLFLNQSVESVHRWPPIVFAVRSAKGRFGPKHFLHGFRGSARKAINRNCLKFAHLRLG